MKKTALIACITLFALALNAAERKLQPLPITVSNNAVASVKIKGQQVIFSFMGIGERKSWDSITNRAFGMNVEAGEWSEVRPVPGPAGRIAGSAVTVKDVIYLLGGYTVDSRGIETSVRSVELLLPSKGIWYRAADMPAPLDDTVVGAYRDRYIYTVSGWTPDGATNQVQVYDTQKDKWQQATPIPGTPVFGHAGALLDDTIVYVDGAFRNPNAATPRYVASDECWMGKIDHHDLTKIQWSKLPSHPGSARYRIAAGASDHDDRIYFSGGTDNPYNYDGVGYDGRPSEPSPMTFAWNLKTSKWEVVTEKTQNPTMDNRGLLVTSRGLLRVGGMEAGQRVTNKVNISPRAGK
jgi:N-acetylneuraminic acid mutarotase